MTAALSSMSASSDSNPSCGGTLVSIDGRVLPLRDARLAGRHRAGLGRVTLEQTFENPYAEPLRVTYQLPLPEEGSVSGFSFRVGQREIVGEVDRKNRARERFEQAIAQGRSAAHLEQERASLFTQEVGNIPPGTTVVVKIEIDQRLVWIPDAAADTGGWEWRFPTVVAPRYVGSSSTVPDADRVRVATSDRPRPISMSLDLTIADALLQGRSPTSPSHALALGRGGHVSFAAEAVGLDRDVVVRWPVATPKVGIAIDVARPKPGHAMEDHLFGLVTLTPPSIRPAPVARDLVVLLDTSGSMSGEPLAQAKRVTSALIESLSEQDTLELIEFSSRTRRFAEAPMSATPQARARALQWVGSLRASGGTEMVSGILAALRSVRAEAQRQVVVVTDGLIGFERDVVSAILEQLPSGSRLHTVGVGSAVNRSLTGPAARAGRGLEVVIGLGEDPERACQRLLERTGDPLVVDLVLKGDGLLEHAPRRLPDLYANSPALISVKLARSGGTLRVRGRTASGPWEARVEAQADDHGSPGVIGCFARERVEDHELARTAGVDEGEADAAITQLGLQFQIATRLTSWVAISDRVDVDPTDPTRRETVPQEIPYGMSVEGLGLRAASIGAAGAPPPQLSAPAPASAGPGAARTRGAPPRPQAKAKKTKGGILRRILGGSRDASRDDSAVDGFSEGEASAEVELSSDALEANLDMMDKELGRRETLTQSGIVKDGKGYGVVLSKTDDVWIVEVLIPDGIDWSPADDLMIRFADGTDVRAAIVTDGTTRDGEVPPGTRIRLVVRVSEPSEQDPRSLSLTNKGRAFAVVF